MGCTRADPTRDPDAQFIPEMRSDHAGDRTHGGRRRLGGGLGRHGDQDRRGEDCRCGRLPHVRGARAASCIRSGASKRARAAPGSIRPRRPRRCASNGSPARCKPAGELHVDAGAAAALRRGKSLLPAGVTEVVGRFERGDAVIVRDAERQGDRARPVRVLERRRRAAARPQIERDRGAARLSRSRRDHPSRRPGDHRRHHRVSGSICDSPGCRSNAMPADRSPDTCP